MGDSLALYFLRKVQSDELYPPLYFSGAKRISPQNWTISIMLVYEQRGISTEVMQIDTIQRNDHI